MKLFFHRNRVIEIVSNYFPFKIKKKILYGKILIFDFHMIGDMVILLPFLSHIRRNFPSSHIVLVSPKWVDDILLNTSYVDEIIYYHAPWVKRKSIIPAIKETFYLVTTLRKKRFDIGIEMRGDIRQIFLMWLCGPRNIAGYSFTGGKRMLTIDVPDDGKIKHLIKHHKQILESLTNKKVIDEKFVPELVLSHEERSKVELIKSNYKKKVIGIHPFAGSKLRQWSFDRVRTLIERLQKNYNIVMFFGPDDLKYQDSLLPIDSSNIEIYCSDLREFIVKVATLDYMICMDSGAGHIAAALRIPVVVIFGPAIDTYCNPVGKSPIKVVTLPDRDLPCRPCDQKKCTNEIYNKCLKELSVDMVIDGLGKIIEQV